MPLAREIATVGSGTLVSRLLAYGRDAGIAALLGAGPFAEAFFAVLQLVNFFRRLMAEGALNGAFVPLWLSLRAGEGGAAAADRFTRRSFVVMLCLAGIVALLAIVLAPCVIAVIAPGFDEGRRALAALYLHIVAPYIVLAGLVAVFAAALAAEGRVGAVAVSTGLFNFILVLVLAAVLLEHVGPLTASLWLAAAVMIAGLVQLAVTAGAWLATGRRFRRARGHAEDSSRTLFIRAGPALVAAGIPQLKLIAGAAIVSSSPAAVSWLYYANRLYELPLGLASVAVAAAIVPRIAASIRADDGEAFTAAQSRAIELALGLALPAAAGYALLAVLIAGALFERGAFDARDTVAVAAALAAICAGLPGHVLEKVFGAVSFAHEDTRTPMLAALGGLAVAIAGGLLLFPRFGYVGVAAAIALSGWIGSGLLGLALRRRGHLRLDADARRRLPRIVLATAIMGVAVYAGHRLLPDAAGTPGRFAILLALVVLGLAVYGAALQMLGVTRLKALIAAARVKP
jgi:putative peptidoglycan lipid II flippase